MSAVLGAVLLASGACEQQTTTPAIAAAGSPSADSSAGASGAGVTESARECTNGTARRGYPYSCLSCEGLACEPTDTCEIGAHATGPGISRCRCVGATFSCGFTPRSPDASGGADSSGGGDGSNGNLSGATAGGSRAAAGGNSSGGDDAGGNSSGGDDAGGNSSGVGGV